MANTTQKKELTLSKSGAYTTGTGNKVGDVITYTYTIANTATTTLGPAQFTVSDNKINSGTSFNCGPAAPPLSPSFPTRRSSDLAGSFVTCTATYAITQANIDAGSVTN